MIGFHGQTVFHDSSSRTSVQLGNPELLSFLTKKDIVFNFRQNDLLNGGQGAPIAPIYHQLISKELNLPSPSCLINIGGISNLTFCNNSDLIGFDTGPGNNLMDLYCQLNLKTSYDKHGSFASKGNVNDELVEKYSKKEYFLKKWPKSLDKYDFYEILKDIEDYKLSKVNALATLAELTINTILKGISILPFYPKLIVIMGGGANNLHIIRQLKTRSRCKVVTAQEINLNGEMIEAELIAFLSARKVYNLPSTFPSTTGTNLPTINGEYFTFKAK